MAYNIVIKVALDVVPFPFVKSRIRNEARSGGGAIIRLSNEAGSRFVPLVPRIGLRVEGVRIESNKAGRRETKSVKDSVQIALLGLVRRQGNFAIDRVADSSCRTDFFLTLVLEASVYTAV